MSYLPSPGTTGSRRLYSVGTIGVVVRIARAQIGIAVLLITSSYGNAQESPVVHSPISPEESLKHFVVAPGLEVQLVAHEPQVIDPVAVRFDEHGQMWVVEMRDYPEGPQDGEIPKSRISILNDCDGDGFFETASVFADNLLFANGLQLWKGGVFVTMAGQVAYMKDTNGDGRADVVDTWYTGFAEKNTQLRANHPTLALDNHIYIAGGLTGGMIVDAEQTDVEPVSVNGMDFRFDPVTRKFEAVSGAGQFGLSFDDYGNRFVCTNRNPAIHIVLENRHLVKNPLVTVPAVSCDVAKAGAESRVFPITRSWTTSNLHAGQITAACGITIYRGGALPKEFHGNLFVCEPTGHLIHREIMEPHGITFRSKPARDGVDFLASRDEWCCPVNLEIAPDGALVVVDIYRAVIEHPEWMPDELKNRPDLHFGNDRGRIYRIVRKSADHGSSSPELSSSSSAALVENLSHKNAWWRETSARLLLERADQSVAEQLRQVVTDHESPLARIHALWIMKGMDLITDELLIRLLEHQDPKVLEQVIIVSEGQLERPGPLRDNIAQFCSHEDARVRYRAMLALAPSPAVPTSVTDEWELRAFLIAAGNRAGSVLAQILDDIDQEGSEPAGQVLDPQSAIVELAGLAAATKDNEQHQLAVNALLASGAPGQVGLIRFLAEAVRNGISVAAIRGKLQEAQQLSLDQRFNEALATATNLSEPDSARSRAIDLLALQSDTAQAIIPLAIDDPSQAVRLKVVEELSKQTEVEPWQTLLAGFSNELPIMRRAILENILSRSDRTNWLLDEISAGKIMASEIGRNHIDQLLNHPDVEIKARAEQLLGGAIPANRQNVLADYQVVLTMKADEEHGRKVFKKNCATCHQIDEVGINVAADISDSSSKTAQQYLTDIIDPNRAIDANYVSYLLITENGQSFSGILATETATSITLKQAEGKMLTIRRNEIAELTSNGTSFMPEGMEKEIPHQDMADLIAFIKNWRYLDGRTPLGHDQVDR